MDRVPVVASPATGRGGAWERKRDGLLGALLDGRFRVLSLRAEGGLSAVYRGTDEQRHERPLAGGRPVLPAPGDAVAIKMLHEAVAGMPAMRRRFAREAELAARLGGRVGAASRATGIAFGRPFLVLDYLDGETVRERLARAGGALPIGAAIAIANRVLARVALLHSEGLVHNDLKPANVHAGSGALIDLGSAQPIGATIDGPGGGACYGAPELLRDSAVADPRADIYAVGVMLFTMIAGRRPPGTAAGTPLSARDRAPLPSLATCAPSVSPALVDVVARAMARDAEARFASAEAMREALRPLRSEEDPCDRW